MQYQNAFFVSRTCGFVVPVLIFCNNDLRLKPRKHTKHTKNLQAAKRLSHYFMDKATFTGKALINTYK